MYIGITKAIQDKYKIKPVIIEQEIPDILSWHARKFVFHRKTGLFIMNDRTRYSIVVFDIKKNEMENLLSIFKEQLKKNMVHDKIGKEKIEKYLTDLTEIKFVKTSNRSILGQLKDSLYFLEDNLYSIGNTAEHDLDYLNARMNDMPMIPLKKLDYVPYPNEAMTEEMNKLY